MGLAFDSSQASRLQQVLEQRLGTHGIATAHYVELLSSGHGYDTEIAALARSLTVAETYFFRDRRQMEAFSEVILSRRATAQAPLRVLSAGCASGEEAYSLAMLAQARGFSEQSLVIDAVDINPDALARAARAVYSAWSLRETPEEHRTRWFQVTGDGYALDERIRRQVHFRACNLVEASSQAFPHGPYDAIFCRNVLMYFSHAKARDLVAGLWRQLAPLGHLFLGHAETLRGLSDAFDSCNSHEAFYYRRRSQGATLSGGAEVVTTRSDDVGGLAGAPGSSVPWFDVIARASARVTELTGTAVRSAAEGRQATATEQGRPRSADFERSLSLLGEERFAEALVALQQSAERRTRDPDTLMLEAALLAQAGRLGEAEGACRWMLARDDLNAGAHFLLALCNEGTGDLEEAIRQAQRASHLDTTFAMPRLHLGMLYRRKAEFGPAREALTAAETLLCHEDARRLLLFGGGFSRDALLAVCRAELQICQEGHSGIG
jgi:chemotaxis protein methyltransferase CheR